MQLTLRAQLPSGARSEAALVDQARAGDDRAFEELYARYRERIHAFILSKVRDHGRAEDLGQEVFISALRQLRATDSEIIFKPWLYTIARNACIDEFRRGARVREVSLESDGLPAGSRGVGLQSGLPTPAAAIESKQTLADLRSAFDGLNETQHKLLVMREFEGLSYDEIGTRLGMTRQMVESGLFRARRKLGAEYDELASGRRCEQIQTAIDAGELQTARGLGIKLRRRYSRHLSHCQPCRHVAMVAGVDDALLKPRSIVDKVAGLLPFPLLRQLVSRGTRGASHHAGGGLAGGAGATGAGAAGLGAGQAAAIAALVIGGAGGGLVAVDQATASHHTGARAIAHIAGAGRSPAAGHATVSAGSPSGPGRSGAGASPGGRLAARTSARGSSAGGGGGPVPRGPGGGSGSGNGSGSGSGSGSGNGSGSGTGSGGGSGSGGGAGTGSSTHHRGGTGTTSTGVGTKVSGVTTTAQKTVTGVGTTVNKTVSGVGKAVNKTVSGVGTTVQKTTSGVGTTVNKTVSGVGKAVNKTVSGVAPGVGTTVQKTTSGVGTTVQKTTSGVGTTAQKTTSGVGTTVDKTTTGVATTVQKTVSGVTGGGSSSSGTTTTSTSTNPVSTLLGPILP